LVAMDKQGKFVYGVKKGERKEEMERRSMG
jgi:hypothetical protein